MSIFRFFSNRTHRAESQRCTEGVGAVRPRGVRRLCRIEQMEKRTLLAVDPTGLTNAAMGTGAEVSLTAYEEDWSTTGETTGLTADAQTAGLGTDANGTSDVTSNYVSPDPISAGLVFSEDNYDGQTNDTQPDTFIFGWVGGAEGTLCTQIVLDAKDGLLFDLDLTSNVTNGKYGGFACVIDQTRSDSTIDFDKITITQTSEQIKLSFADGYGLAAGQKLYFTVDLDRVIADSLYGSDVNGIDLQAYLTYSATFDHSQYSTPEIQGQGMSDSYETPEALVGVLPTDGWNSDTENAENKTAGGFAEVVQTPLPCTITGTVWADLSLDCTVDDAATERRFEGVTITLTSTDGSVSKTTTTNSDGYYEFTNLDPTLVYTVTESTQPDDYYDSPKPCGTNSKTGIQPEPSGTAVVNFAEIPYASLSGHVWEDNDNDGVWDDGEKAIAGATVYLLDENGDRIDGKVATTQTNGSYEFTSLVEGTYGLEQILPEGYYNGTYAIGTITTVVDDPAKNTGTKTTLADKETDEVTGIVLSRGAVGENFDFGELPPAEIIVTVWADMSQDCTIDEGETRISGVEVSLYDSEGNVVASGTTGTDGTCQFADLDPRITYSLSETKQPEGYYDSPKPCGTNTKTDLQPPAGGTLTTQIAELPYASISGYVWEDENNDGVWDDDEPAIPGATVYLLDADGNRIEGKSTTTNADGYYAFTSLETGTYGLEEILPDGYVNGKYVKGGGTIRDLDGNATDNSTGTDSITGTTSFVKQIELTAGSKGVNFNFGELSPASLEGIVYYDEDYDGVYDEGEELLSGVTVKLIASDDTVLTAITDTNGAFLFENLTPFETYTLEETQPTGYLDARETVGTGGGESSTWVWSPYTDNDTITEITLGNGFKATGYRFGEVKPASISGNVFQDGDAVEYEEGETKPSVENTDKTGVYKSGDKMIGGVTLTLGDASGEPILDANGNKITATTDSDGHYIFENLFPGTYTVMESQPDQYDDGLDTPGSKDGFAFNQGVTVPDDYATISGNIPANDAIAEIPLKAGDAATDYNFSEIVTNSVTTPDPTPGGYSGGSSPGVNPSILSPSPTLVGSNSGTGSNYSPNGTHLTTQLGGGLTLSYAWHLAVINGGSPRQRSQTYSTFIAEQNGTLVSSLNGVTPEAWGVKNLGGAAWMMIDSNGNVIQLATLGLPGGTPLSGDWDGDGVEEAGVYYGGYFWLDTDGDGLFGDSDLWIQLGDGYDHPVAGDWDGDGRSDIGVYGVEWGGDRVALESKPGTPDLSNRTEIANLAHPIKNVPPWVPQATDRVKTLRNTDGLLRQDLVDHVFRFGADQDIPVTGDWNSDGVTNIGLFRDGKWSFDMDGDGRFTESDRTNEFGAQGDLPITGDWSGDGHVQIGVFRDGMFILDSNSNRQLDSNDRRVYMEDYQSGDIPVAFDYNGDGVTEVGVYRPNLWQQLESDVALQDSHPGRNADVDTAEDAAEQPLLQTQ